MILKIYQMKKTFNFKITNLETQKWFKKLQKITLLINKI